MSLIPFAPFLRDYPPESDPFSDCRLNVGSTCTAISNTAATPIAGTFANLPDGSIITIHFNNLQASYEGGDGNDLTLIVVP
jgi:hypothetical protein